MVIIMQCFISVQNRNIYYFYIFLSSHRSLTLFKTLRSNISSKFLQTACYSSPCAGRRSCTPVSPQIGSRAEHVTSTGHSLASRRGWWPSDVSSALVLMHEGSRVSIESYEDFDTCSENTREDVRAWTHRCTFGHTHWVRIRSRGDNIHIWHLDCLGTLQTGIYHFNRVNSAYFHHVHVWYIQLGLSVRFATMQHELGRGACQLLW